MSQPFSWQLKCLKLSLRSLYHSVVESTVIVVTNELSEVIKQAFRYDNPFKEIGDNHILVQSNIFSKMHSRFLQLADMAYQ